MMRPMSLELVPNEVYPGTRDNSSRPAKTLVIQDMPHMASFVYDLYHQKVNAMKNTHVQVS